MSTINTNTYITQLQTFNEEEVAYKECCRNHAVAVGGASYDGCNEYLKASAANLHSPDTFLCACCGCHRNFHRKHIASNSLPQTETENDYGADVVPVSGPFPSGPTDNPEAVQQVRPLRRKRTTFSRDQKSQMTRFAEILGWKPHKGNREDIQRFCTDMGISRKIFVVWLNNNRHRATQNVSHGSDP